MHLTRRGKLALLASGVLILIYFVVTWPIPVQVANLETEIPLEWTDSPFYPVLAQAATGSNGNVILNVNDFEFESPDGSTKVSASSAAIKVNISPTAEESARVDLDVQLSMVSVKSSQISGTFSSVKLTGYVNVDPKTNRMVTSIVAQTSIADILRAIIGI